MSRTGTWRARIRRAGRFASGAAIAVWGTSRLNLAATAADLKLNGAFVTGTADFNATMAQSSALITVNLDSPMATPTLTTAAEVDF